MANQTIQQFREALEACDFRQPDQVSKLVTSSYTNVAFNDKVEEKLHQNPLGAANYFGGLFGTEVWPDGQGYDEVKEYYADPHIPFTFSHFVRQSAICDPNLADECRRDRCEVPEGGRGTLPPFVFYRAGLKTPRDCIANIRHIRNFRYWANKIIRSRELMDEQMMNMFYTMAGIQTAGSKIVLQGYRDPADNQLKLLPSNNPRNPLRFGLFNYMEEKFPQIQDLNLLVPLTVDALEGLARFWAQFPKNNEIAKGPRGESIYEFWYPDDWYYTEAVRNPDYLEKLKITMPAKMFSGYSLVEGQREVIGNWAPRVMPWLPRFAPTSDGRIVPVDSYVGVDIEVGKEYVGSVAFENAPIGMAVIVSGKQGTILTRPTLTESGAGFPIMPIAGNSAWRIRNDYDKECNPDLNMPYSEKDYEMGVRMDDPSASVAILFRRRKFNMRPVNECDLAPIFTVESNEIDCDVSTVGCQTKRRMDDNITQAGAMQYVECFAAACGNGTAPGNAYIIKVDRKANQPNFNSLEGIDCGDTVALFVYNADGTYDGQVEATVKSDIAGFPYARYIVELSAPLGEGKCIKGIAPLDDDDTDYNVIDQFDADDGVVSFFLDKVLDCEAGDDVVITFYDADGEVLGDFDGEIDSFNPETFLYTISSQEEGFKADAFDGQAHINVSCDS